MSHQNDKTNARQKRYLGVSKSQRIKDLIYDCRGFLWIAEHAIIVTLFIVLWGKSHL